MRLGLLSFPKIQIAIACIFLAWCQRALNYQHTTIGENLEVNQTINTDPAVNALIQPYKADLDREMDVVIGKASQTLDNSPGQGESLLGNFVSDLLLKQSEKKFGKKIDMAIINAHGGLRTNINQGPITMRAIFELMPFENNMLVLELNGKLTRKFFDHCAVTKRNNIAGARFVIEADLAKDIEIQGEPLDDQKNYTLAIADYLANGGGGFSLLSEAKTLQNLHYKVRDMIIDYIKLLHQNGQQVDAKKDGRITILHTP